MISFVDVKTFLEFTTITTIIYDFWFLANACKKEKDICNSFDSNQDGYIEGFELLKIFPYHDPIHKIFIEVDDDQDGKITTKECLVIVRTIGFRFSL